MGVDAGLGRKVRIKSEKEGVLQNMRNQSTPRYRGEKKEKSPPEHRRGRERGRSAAVFINRTRKTAVVKKVSGLLSGRNPSRK